MKNKSVHSCRFVHHAKFHCIMAMLNRLFKIEFERGGLEKSLNVSQDAFSISRTGKEPKKILTRQFF